MKNMKEHVEVIFYFIVVILLVLTLSLVMILFNDVSQLNKIIVILGQLQSIQP